MNRLSIPILLAAASLAYACDGDGAHALLVDLQTDWVAGAEFSSVHVRVEPPSGPPIEALPTAVATGAEAERAYRDGARVAELARLGAGAHRVVIELQDADGRVVATRGIRLEVEGATGLLVIIARDCRDVVCPAAGAPDLTECVGGACAAPECSPDRRDFCPAPECTTSADCASADACAIGVCTEEGACLFTPDSTRCATGEYCDPDRGCTMLPAGMDAGMDAGADTGTDTSTDTGTDTSDASMVDPSLIAWWPLDDTDPASTGIVDRSGNGHDGVCAAGCPTPTTGRIDGAMSFASMRHFEIPHDPAFVSPTGFTVTAWARLDATPPSMSFIDIVAKPLGSGVANSWQLTMFDTDMDGDLELRWLTFENDSALFFVDVASPFTPGDWVHVAGTFSSASGDLVIYVGGIERGRRGGGGVAFDTNPILIGADENGGSRVNGWPGLIDDVRYYGRTLSEAEIATLAAGGS